MLEHSRSRGGGGQASKRAPPPCSGLLSGANCCLSHQVPTFFGGGVWGWSGEWKDWLGWERGKEMGLLGEVDLGTERDTTQPEPKGRHWAQRRVTGTKGARLHRQSPGSRAPATVGGRPQECGGCRTAEPGPKEPLGLRRATLLRSESRFSSTARVRPTRRDAGRAQTGPAASACTRKSAESVVLSDTQVSYGREGGRFWPGFSGTVRTQRVCLPRATSSWSHPRHRPTQPCTASGRSPTESRSRCLRTRQGQGGCVSPAPSFAQGRGSDLAQTLPGVNLIISAESTLLSRSSGRALPAV